MGMDRAELIEKAKALAAERVTPRMDLDEKVDVLEMAMMELLDVQIMKPPIGRAGSLGSGGFDGRPKGKWLMHEEPRLPEMPDKPSLIDFFKLRFSLDTVGYNHLLQSAKLAMSKDLPDNTVLACLLHDVSVVGLVRTDHGHWAAQLVAPYVDPEVSWAIKHHQALRFRPDAEWGYEYPKTYMEVFGEDYEPPDYVQEEWDYCQAHEWFPHAMQIVVNDLYAFDPNVTVDIEEFRGVIERAFRNPPEGLGFDRSPVAHMWRTMIWPNNFL